LEEWAGEGTPGEKEGGRAKGREEGVLRRWEAEGKCKTLKFVLRPKTGSLSVKF